MYALLSPAKKMSFDRQRTGLNQTKPSLTKYTNKILTVLKQKSQDDLADLMNLSDNLAQLNYDRYQSFSTAEESRAIEAFQGDTYVGFAQQDLSDDNLNYAQNHIGILSGLYGLLRPFDLIKPYRLEMGTKLKIDQHKKLYDFWGDVITDCVNQYAQKSEAIINLASKEYISAINTDKLNAPFVTCDFKEMKDGQAKTIGLYAKRARGMMARYIVENRVETLDDLKNFNSADYQFSSSSSDAQTLVFIR